MEFLTVEAKVDQGQRGALVFEVQGACLKQASLDS